MLPMTLDPAQLPDDIATLKAMVIAAESEGERPRAGDRGPQAHHRQAAAQHVRRLLRAW